MTKPAGLLSQHMRNASRKWRPENQKKYRTKN
jgi:hypothetical protein